MSLALKSRSILLAASLLSAGFARTAEESFSVATMFSDHMVLQRDKPVRVWGLAPVGSRVVVTFAGASVEGIAATNGDWCVELPAQPVRKTGMSLTVTPSVGSPVVFTDVLVGDVWLMAGQSNMEFPFRKSTGAAAWASKADGRRNIRQLRVRQARAILPRTDAACDGWRVCTSNALMTTDVSGVGYACVCELNGATDVPQGIIETHWGGCLIEPFISLEGYRSVPDLAVPYVTDIERARARHSRDRYLWKDRQDKIIEYADYLRQCRAERREPDLLPFKHIAFEGFDPFYGTAYNAMIAPLTRLPIAGCFWYQGESNIGCRIYDKFMKALAFGWRTAWGDDFPIYVCQRSSVEKAVIDLSKNNTCARFRDLQRRMIPGLGKSGLVVTTDVGADYEHPENKIDVGLRCARWALRDLYGRDVVPTGPMFKGFVREGSRLRASFDFAKGLMAAEKDPQAPGVPPVRKATNKVRGFAVYGEDNQWHLASAEIDGETVVVWAEGVKRPRELRYAHFSNTIGLADLYNGEGLPAAAFRTDDQDWQNK